MKNYQTMPASIPWQLLKSTLINNYAVGDIDGDEREEIITLSDDGTFLLIFSYFKYGDLSSSLSDTTWGQVVTMWTSKNVVSGPTSSWTLSADDQIFVANIDLSSSGSEVVIFNPNTSSLGVLKWTGTELQCVWFSTQEIPGYGSASSWVMTPGATSLTPISLAVGGETGFVIFDRLFRRIGVLDWMEDATTSGNLCCIWQATGEVFEGLSPMELVPDDQYFGVNMTGLSHSVMRWNPSMALFAALQWIGKLEVVWSGGGSVNGAVTWTLGAGDRFYCADVDGDGADEIVAVVTVTDATIPVGGVIGVFRWSNSEIECIGTQGLPGAVNTPLFPRFTDGGQSSNHIVIFNPEGFLGGTQEPRISVFQWDSDNHLALDQGYSVNSVAAGENSSSWTLKNSDQFFCADVDGDGDDEIIALAAPGAAMGVFKWNGSELLCVWQVSTVVNGWGLNLIADAPATPFPYAQESFTTGDQPAIYQFISNELYQTIQAKVSDCVWCNDQSPCSQNDIRSCYKCLDNDDFVALLKQLQGLTVDPDYSATDWSTVTAALTQDFMYAYASYCLDSASQGDIRAEFLNLNKAGDFANYQTILNEANGDSIPPMPGAPASDWAAMKAALAEECGCVDDVMNLIHNMNTFAQDLEDLQTGEVSTVINNVDSDVQSQQSSAALFWIGEIADSLICGASVIPEEKEAQGALAMTASLFGTALSSTSANTPPQEVMLTEYEPTIEHEYATSIANNNQNEVIVLQDAFKLPFVNSLANAAWTWPPEFTNSASGDSDPSALLDLTATQNAYRLDFYKMIIPARFKIMVWNSADDSRPYYLAGGNRIGWETYYINVPSQAVYTESVGHNEWNIYVIFGGSDDASKSGSWIYPTTTLTDDLFQTLGVSKEDFFKRLAGWNTIQSITYEPSSL